MEVKLVGTAWWLNGETLTEVQIQFKYKTHLAQYQVYLTKYQIYLAKYQIHSPKYQIHLPKYQTHPPQYHSTCDDLFHFVMTPSFNAMPK